ncbi:MAG: glycosyltransferase family 9 protein [Crocinitomicaceae bacterium]|nr:glycosyltransferase family 9 protein [Crocinitomicaceae bacterium]
MKTTDLNNKRLVISRTDSIGDVLLTLPICAWIKSTYPTATILFLGKGYTKSVVECYGLVDEFIDWKDYENQPKVEQVEGFRSLNADAIIHVFPNKDIASLAKKVKIPVRVGTSHRSYHLLTCTHRPNFTRKRSDLHESQLNHELLRPFGLTDLPTLEQIIAATSHFLAPKAILPSFVEKALQNKGKSIILHPKSQGSAREWPIEKYVELTDELVQRDYTVFFTGTQAEGDLFRDQIPTEDSVIDTTGKLSLDELITFISKVDYLLACSTGPLHIAGYLGINTIGFFVPRRPIHPGRWKALGPKVSILVNDPECAKCAKKVDCNCIADISVDRVLELLP